MRSGARGLGKPGQRRKGEASTLSLLVSNPLHSSMPYEEMAAPTCDADVHTGPNRQCTPSIDAPVRRARGNET